MTNVEKLAVLNACFGINFCEQPESRGGKYADVFLKHDRMSDMCRICNWFELNPFNDSEFIQRAHTIDPELQIRTILQMDPHTALLAYVYMYNAANLHGSPSRAKIELFDLFGRAHRITYAEFSPRVESIKDKLLRK